MTPDETLDAMTDLCILAGQSVMKDGSTELRAAMRIVLAILGREVAKRAVGYDAAASIVRMTARSTRRTGTAASKPSRRGNLAHCA